MMPESERLVLKISGEFASICVQVRGGTGRETLEVADRRSGRRIWLDALELEGLVWARHADLVRLLDPTDAWDRG